MIIKLTTNHRWHHGCLSVCSTPKFYRFLFPNILFDPQTLLKQLTLMTQFGTSNNLLQIASESFLIYPSTHHAYEWF